MQREEIDGWAMNEVAAVFNRHAQRNPK